MKVTKLIREHVVRSVHKAFPCEPLPEFAAVKVRYEEAKRVYFAEMKRIGIALVAELKETYEIPDDWGFEFCDRVCLSGSEYSSNLARKNRDHLDEVMRKREAKIDEILLQLELGANREELNKIIFELVNGKD